MQSYQILRHSRFSRVAQYFIVKDIKRLKSPLKRQIQLSNKSPLIAYNLNLCNMHKPADHFSMHFYLFFIRHCAICTKIYMKFLLDIRQSFVPSVFIGTCVRLLCHVQYWRAFHGLRVRNVSKYHALRALCNLHKNVRFHAGEFVQCA